METRNHIVTVAIKIDDPAVPTTYDLAVAFVKEVLDNQCAEFLHWKGYVIMPKEGDPIVSDGWNS